MYVYSYTVFESSTDHDQVANLGKAIATAGILGSQALPAEARASKETHEGATFTVIGNAGALALAKHKM